MENELKSKLTIENGLKKVRPLREFSSDDVFNGGHLAIQNRDLEFATMVYDELFLRLRENYKGSSEKTAWRELLNLFKKSNLVPIPWLSNAQEIIVKMNNLGDIGEGSHNAYVILIGGLGGNRGFYSVYVGETSKPPEERFHEHKNGIRSGRGTGANCISLLPTLMPFLNFKRENRHIYESYLNCMLTKTQYLNEDLNKRKIEVRGNSEILPYELPKVLRR